MNRWSLWPLTVSIGFVAACGGLVVVDRDGSGGASGTGGALGTCNEPPPPSPKQPTEPGCYRNDGSGWIEVACDCDLWLRNTSQAPATARIRLTVAPPQVPSLAGPIDVEVAFEDPDATLYAIWASQIGGGQAFAVVHAGTATTVRMGASDVTLPPVPVAACETEKGHALVIPANGADVALQIHAVLEDGTGPQAVDATCQNAHPTKPAP